MENKSTLSSGAIASAAVMALSGSAWAATSLQVGASGKTFASSMVRCAAGPTPGVQSPVIDAGLFNPKRGASATVSLNGTSVATVTADIPATNVWLADGANTAVVALSKRTADSYTFNVQPGMCAPQTLLAIPSA